MIDLCYKVVLLCFLKLIVTYRLCVIYMKEDNDSNV